MKLFDALVHSDCRADRDFENMAWFDVERVVTCAHSPRTFETARDLEEYLEHLICEEPERLRRLGVIGHVAVGIHPRAVPARAHYEIWRRLPDLLRQDGVVALGELGLVDGYDREWRLVERQLRVVAEHDIDTAIVFRLPRRDDTRLRVRWIRRLASLLSDVGLSASDVLLHGIDWLTADEAETHGFYLGLEVGPFGLDCDTAMRIIEHHDRRRLIVASGMRAGPANVLALPRLAVSLAESGTPAQDIERVLYGNAMGLYIR